MKNALSPELKKKIDEVCARADAAYLGGEYEGAAELFIEAFRLLPKPVDQWETTYWLIKMWGMSYLAAGNFEAAENSFESARFYPQSKSDPELLDLLKEARAKKRSGKLRTRQK